MEPRALRHIAQVPPRERLPLIKDGLDRLVPHITELAESARLLRKQGRDQAAAILESFATEESAKVLVMLDMLRHGWKNAKITNALSTAFSSHLSRGLYVKVASISPGSFGEVRRYLDHFRQSHYLDDPNDVDWVFRNQIELEREETLYVDLVKYDDGLRWVSPQEHAEFKAYPWLHIIELVLAMNRLEMFTSEGLHLILNSWADVSFADDLSWPENHSRTHALIRALAKKNLPSDDATREDADLVLDRWSFPMGALDLRQQKITRQELDEERAAAQARANAELYEDFADPGW